MKDKPDYAVLWKGHGGVHAELQDGGMSTPYDTRLEPYYERLIEGGWVIDKCPAFDKTSNPLKLSIESPLCGVDVAPGEVDKCPEPSSTLVAGMSGAFQTLAALKKLDRNYSGLDRISPVDYAAYWSKQGARVGCRKGQEIHWEDGTIEKIEKGE